MTITIAERLRPFCHLPGTICPVPLSTHIVQIFPAKIIVDNSRTIDLHLSSPMTQFTVMLDLERPSVVVSGWCGDLYIRYRIIATKDDVAFLPEKNADAFFPSTSVPLPAHHPFERLSLGSHKKPDWELVQRRGDLTEILPQWFALGQMVPQATPSEGPSLLRDAPLIDIFRAGFRGILTPQCEDAFHQGFALPPTRSSNPFSLLSEGAQRIRSLFFTSEGAEATLLATEFHCGRLLNLSWAPYGALDIEWTKHQMRRMQFRAASTTMITFNFPKETTSCRLVEGGRRLRNGESFEVNAGSVYTLDRFEK